MGAFGLLHICSKLLLHLAVIKIAFSPADVALAGKAVFAMSAYLTMDVDMARVRIHGNASVMKAGEVFSVTKVNEQIRPTFIVLFKVHLILKFFQIFKKLPNKFKTSRLH